MPTPKKDPLQPMRDALVMHPAPIEGGLVTDIDAALRSAVRAVLPGRQQKKNLTPILDAARRAFVRTLRRRARS